MPDLRASDHLPVSAPEQRMQRLRVGVTGLAAILLVVALATAIASGLRRTAANEASAAPPPVVATVPPTENGIDPNAEPLAQLGVAPGGAADTTPPAKQSAQ